MECAIFIPQIKYLDFWNSRYTRIYFGNEFCQELIPSIKELQEILDFVSKKKLSLTLVTCFVTDQGLEKLKDLFELLSQSLPGSEVVINDWGVFNFVKNYGLKPVLGRLMVKQKRDPRILKLGGRLKAEISEYLKEVSINDYFYGFLDEQKLQRIEIDNSPYEINLKPDNKAVSFYFPFGFVTTTRFCPLSPQNKSGKRVGVFLCKRECQRYSILLNPSFTPLSLFSRGNTVFFANHKQPNNLSAIGVNRIIYEPIVPF